MKIEKTKSRKYKNKQYHKFRIVLPGELLKEADFKEGDELQAQAKKGEIRLSRK